MNHLLKLLSKEIVGGLSRDPPCHREYRGDKDDREDTLQITASFIGVEPLNP
jgi:hypothetical protein